MYHTTVGFLTFVTRRTMGISPVRQDPDADPSPQAFCLCWSGIHVTSTRGWVADFETQHSRVSERITVVPNSGGIIAGCSTIY